MIVEVIRPLPGPNGLIPPGTQIDTVQAGWPVRRASQLIRFHYVAPVTGITQPMAAQPAPIKRGPGRPPKVRPAEEAIP